MITTPYSYVQNQLSSVWPEWKITAALGKGTFGQVYEILRNDLGTGYKCALKVLQYEADESDPGLEEFVRSVSREIDMMMQLKGAPNIVTIEDYAVLRNQGSRTILIRMELLESVEKIRKQIGGLDRQQTLQMGLDICTALISCEQLNIIHRDIKLSNIFYSEKGGYKLGDFGISRTMDSIHEKNTMSSAGTIQYIAPEVYLGYKYDNTADIYSLGIALYILLNNNLPPLCNDYNVPPEEISRSMIHEANMRRLRGEHFNGPVNADQRLASIILTACDPDPARRYFSASQFREALLAYRDGRPDACSDGPDTMNATSRAFHRGQSEEPATVLLFSGDTHSSRKAPDRSPGESPDRSPSPAQVSVPVNKGSSGPAGSLPGNPAGSAGSLPSAPGRDPSSRNRILIIVLAILLLAVLVCAFVLFRRASAERHKYDNVTMITPEMEEAVSEKMEEGTETGSEDEAGTETEPAEAEPETVSYDVIWTDPDGNILGKTTYADKDGSYITVSAPEVNGYEPVNDEISLTLHAGADNSVTFVFMPTETAKAMDIPSYDTLLYNGHTYYAYETASIDSFREAQEYCESRGGYLAVINDDGENTALYDYVLIDLGLKSAYFGLTDEKREGSWEWVDGTPYGYSSWAKGQPDNHDGAEHYALFYYKDPSYKWNDGDFGKDKTTGKVIFLIEWDTE